VRLRRLATTDQPRPVHRSISERLSRLGDQAANRTSRSRLVGYPSRRNAVEIVLPASVSRTGTSDHAAAPAGTGYTRRRPSPAPTHAPLAHAGLISADHQPCAAAER
jgi:hypothetical protein